MKNTKQAKPQAKVQVKDLKTRKDAKGGLLTKTSSYTSKTSLYDGGTTTKSGY